MEPFIGQIIMFASTFAPRGWALCDGQLLAISQNDALFSLIGTTYGGDGRTTFALPDLRGRVPMHPGHGPGLSARTLGEKSGVESESLTIRNLPPHSHPLNATLNDAKVDSPTGHLLAKGSSNMYTPDEPSTQLSAAAVGHTGEGQPLSVVQPFNCVNFIIALVGIYPSRN